MELFPLLLRTVSKTQSTRMWTPTTSAVPIRSKRAPETVWPDPAIQTGTQGPRGEHGGPGPLTEPASQIRPGTTGRGRPQHLARGFTCPTRVPLPVTRGRLTTLTLEASLAKGLPPPPSVPRLQALARQRTGEQAPGDSRCAEAPGWSGRPPSQTFCCPGMPGQGWVGGSTLTWTSRSRENSRVNSFCISCDDTAWGPGRSRRRGRRASDPGCFLASCSTL